VLGTWEKETRHKDVEAERGNLLGRGKENRRVTVIGKRERKLPHDGRKAAAAVESC
jgi:hypothetical protein